MKPVIVAFLLIVATLKLSAQCVTGNCTNGYGSCNYGWCVYTGEFKNSKPEGKGTMKYDDYSYTGLFANGLEDGEGIIVNKDGSKENVRYRAGKRVTSELVKVPENEYKPLDIQDKGCLSGNCNTGFGTYQFPSGNKYTGNFNDHKREGPGIIYFANGDKFDGSFHDNEKTTGTYSFSTGAKYTGTYDSNGLEYNGIVTSVTGITIPYVNGKAIIPPAPAMPQFTEGDTQDKTHAPAQRIKMPCSVCFGKGKISRTEDWSNYGAGQGGGRETYRLERVYTNCYKCNGSGVE